MCEENCNKEQAKAWQAVWDQCIELGMSFGNTSGLAAVKTFIRQNAEKDAVQPAKTLFVVQCIEDGMYQGHVRQNTKDSNNTIDGKNRFNTFKEAQTTLETCEKWWSHGKTYRILEVSESISTREVKATPPVKPTKEFYYVTD